MSTWSGSGPEVLSLSSLPVNSLVLQPRQVLNQIYGIVAVVEQKCLSKCFGSFGGHTMLCYAMLC